MTVMWLRMVAVWGGSQNIVFLSAGECSLTKPLLCLAWDPTPGLTLHPHPKKAVRAAQAPAFICLLDPQWPLLPAAQTVELGSQGGLFLQWVDLKNDGAVTNLLLPLLTEEGTCGGGIALVCLSCLCSLEAPSREELEDYCSWGPLPPPRPKTNEGKTGIFFFHKETHFCICDREGIYFKPAFFGDNRNIVLSEKNYKYKKIQERLTSIHNTTLHFCAFFQSYVLIFK